MSAKKARDFSYIIWIRTCIILFLTALLRTRITLYAVN